MRYSAIAVALATVAASSVAQAGFVFSSTRTDDAVTANGKTYDRVQFFVLNDGLPAFDTRNDQYSTTGTRVLAMDTYIDSTLPMRWRVRDLPNGPVFPGLPTPPGDGIPDVDLRAAGQTMSSTVYSKFNPELFEFLITNAQTPIPQAISTPTYNAPAAYATTLTVDEVVGASVQGPANAPLANPTPFNFLTLLVESGGELTVSGQIAGDVGPIVGAPGLAESVNPATIKFAFSIQNAVPEPATLGLIAGAGLVALRRRR